MNRESSLALFFLLFSLPALACGGGSTSPPTETPTTLTETASVTPSLPAPTATSQPATIPPPTVEATPPTPAGATVSYNGISFNLNPALGDTAYVHDEQMYGSEVNYTRFTFAPEGWCREVGCVEVYPTTDYRAAFPDQPFPPLGAATLLRAQQQSLDFQNGSGARAIRMYGQAAYFANNESLVYTFAGFTADDQYYVFVEIPIDAPLLMSAADPATNTNPAAQLPQAGQDEAAYNREIEQQLNLLAPADFTPSLSALDALVASLRIEAPSADTPPAEIAAPFRQVVNLDIALPPGKIAGMHAALDGSVWVFTEHGFGRLQDERWIPEPLGSAQTPVGVDDAGRVWVLTDGLMYARDIATDESVAANDGWLPNPNPIGLAGRGVHTDAAGRVWLATWDDVRMFDGRRWTVYAPQDMGMAAPEDPDYFTPYALEVAHQSETLWVGRCDWGGPGPVGGGGARWWDGAAWQGADSPVAEGCVLAIQEDNQGRVWVGVDADLWRYDPAAGEWQRFAPPESSEGYRFGYIEDLALDPSDDPWPLFALCGGASCGVADVRYHLHAGAWAQIGEPSDAPQILAFDGAGTPWLFTADKIVYRIADNQLLLPLVVEPDVAAVAVDPAGRVWVAGTGPDGERGLWMRKSGAAVTGTPVACSASGAQPPEFQLREGQSIVETLTPHIRDYLNARGGAESLQAALGGPFASKDELLPARAQVFTTDVTGDAAPEVVVDFGLFVSDENIDGELFVFTCQDGQYEAIAAEPLLGYVLSDDWPDPGVRAIQDMNGNGKAEIVSSSVVIVGTHANFTRLFQIIEWDGSQFTDLIQGGENQPNLADVSNGDGAIRDIDGDGILELELTHGVGRGPEVSALERSRTDVWAWDGAAFTLADTRAASPPVFRIQALWDGDAATLRGEYDSALADYQQAVFDEELLGWSADRIASDAAYEGGATPVPDSDEWPRLAAYGRYRILLLHAAQGYLPEAQTVYDTLQEKFPEGTVGSAYAALATAFWDEFSAQDDIAAACEAAIDYAAAHADQILAPLGSDFYGFGQPDYAPEDVCPFGQVVARSGLAAR